MVKTIKQFHVKSESIWPFMLFKIITRHLAANRTGHMKNYRFTIFVQTLGEPKKALKMLKMLKMGPHIMMRAVARMKLKCHSSTQLKIKAYELSMKASTKQFALKDAEDQVNSIAFLSTTIVFHFLFQHMMHKNHEL